MTSPRKQLIISSLLVLPLVDQLQAEDIRENYLMRRAEEPEKKSQIPEPAVALFVGIGILLTLSRRR